MSTSTSVIAFVPREVFSTTQRSLETLLARTSTPYQLVVVDGGSPPQIADYLKQAAVKHGFTLLRSDHFLTPNQSRNLAARWAIENTSAANIIFVDNDAMVAPGWLTGLERCADETGAWVVGPAYFEHLPEGQTLHMYGGTCRIETDAEGRRQYQEKHNLAHTPICELSEPLVRCETELIEFHTVLVRREVFETIGFFDEGLFCHAEHGDLCLSVRQAGQSIWLEPAAKVTYVPPRRLEKIDREFFFLRWSEAWLEANQRRIAEKWGVEIASQNAPGRGIHWVRMHRRYGLGFLSTMRRRLGRKPTWWFEKRFVAPMEPVINRWRYPYAQHGQTTTPTVTTINSETKSERLTSPFPAQRKIA